MLVILNFNKFSSNLNCIPDTPWSIFKHFKIKFLNTDQQKAALYLKAALYIPIAGICRPTWVDACRPVSLT